MKGNYRVVQIKEFFTQIATAAGRWPWDKAWRDAKGHWNNNFESVSPNWKWYPHVYIYYTFQRVLSNSQNPVNKNDNSPEADILGTETASDEVCRNQTVHRVAHDSVDLGISRITFSDSFHLFINRNVACRIHPEGWCNQENMYLNKQILIAINWNEYSTIDGLVSLTEYHSLRGTRSWNNLMSPLAYLAIKIEIGVTTNVMNRPPIPCDIRFT